MIGDDHCQLYFNDDGIKGDDQTSWWDAVCFGEIGKVYTSSDFVFCLKSRTSYETSKNV